MTESDRQYLISRIHLSGIPLSSLKNWSDQRLIEEDKRLEEENMSYSGVEDDENVRT